MFWVSSYLNQQLIVNNLQNQSMTDRQTDKQDDYYNPLMHACWGLTNNIKLTCLLKIDNLPAYYISSYCISNLLCALNSFHAIDKKNALHMWVIFFTYMYHNKSTTTTSNDTVSFCWTNYIYSCIHNIIEHIWYMWEPFGLFRVSKQAGCSLAKGLPHTHTDWTCYSLALVWGRQLIHTIVSLVKYKCIIVD